MITDYSTPSNWLRFGGHFTATDIFIVYPTVVFSPDEDDNPFVRLENEKMHRGAVRWLAQFDDIAAECNIFAPLYRQLNGAMLSKYPPKEMANITNRTPRDDIFAAFDYYIREINKNERPFILLGHSQGSQLVMEIATWLLGQEKYSGYNKNHIITYAAGLPVSQAEIARNKHLKFSTSPNDFGVISSWNCSSPNENPENFISWKENTLVNNPLSWGGSVPDGIIVREDKEKGVLFITADETKFHPTPSGISIFHTSEISFFAESLKLNISRRVKSFTI